MTTITIWNSIFLLLSATRLSRIVQICLQNVLYIAKQSFPVEILTVSEKLIGSVENLLDAREYRDIIDRHITRGTLLALLEDLIKKYRREKRRSLEEIWVNDLVAGNTEIT